MEINRFLSGAKYFFHIRAISFEIGPKLRTLYAVVFAAIGLDCVAACNSTVVAAPSSGQPMCCFYTSSVVVSTLVSGQ